ncbi:MULTISPECIES: arginine--tRNA ligase [unclassified Leeuwenhoekiella]|uniref:arginine--tRNA ligase n=1 Tax=unclassified Leeuwenhoekiella TaxID=2615029 RepID=UPI000C581671|nr:MULTISPECIES: arginine--tRNA ligase [unclassified Leeuwenhoekiella]MAW95736.1 arginine--tRNA ligase [Leeuwenhoekiella sp.]MBA81189.1 arginine--tRNA ligase [Leeuwenhoekiella sp.]|tara:strand:+ start:847 stop:2622 length:1776 start_codon:yes stop_codon:yes gene_type:complete
MNLSEKLTQAVKDAVQHLFKAELETVEIQPTRKDFEGDLTVVVFPILRVAKGNPAVIGEQIGAYVKEHLAEISDFNVVKGFLNLVVADAYYLDFFESIRSEKQFGHKAPAGKAVMVEYSSPNTNKPLHLGHIRNNLLGYSVAEILKASGKKVYKTQIINDRGIHICKSMLAWQKFGEGETPESTGLKGDKLVGNYYVKFDKAYKEEQSYLVAQGKTKEEAEKEAPLILEAQDMLRKWEAGDAEVVALWEKMNGWVYEGFEETYKNLGVDFDSYYYESNTYLLGKDNIEEGLKKGVFYKKEDGSVWCDLTEDGLDEKLVLRSDGTAVYMTQDIGTAIQRVKDHPDVGGMIYTVGNEQDYHFKVLFLILKKLGYDWAENLYHLSYGMVDLPSGKMKSREGTVVDADDLVSEMAETAGKIAEELGKLDGYSEAEKQELYKTIGLGALKYYILKVDPKKRILFNPEESVDFQGNTGPFIQYTYARIQSILRKAEDTGVPNTVSYENLQAKEKELIKQIELYPETVQLAAANHSPALIANYTYDLVKEFNSFYQQISILGADTNAEKSFRVALSKKVGEVIESAFGLLGIQVPERM